MYRRAAHFIPKTAILWLIPFLLFGPGSFAYSTEVRGWSIESHTGDDGDFSHCSMTADYVNGFVLIFSLDEDLSLNFALLREEWRLPLGDRYRVVVSIDNRELGMLDALAFTEQGILIPFGNTLSTFKLFQHGHTLRIRTSEDVFGFELDGTLAGLNTLRDCVNRHVSRRPRSTNPFKPEDTNPFSNSDKELESIKEFVEFVLRASGMEDLHILNDPRVTGSESAPISWYSESIFGFFTGWPIASISVETEIQEFILGLIEFCKGPLDSRGEKSFDANAVRLLQISNSCRAEDGPIYFESILVMDSEVVIAFVNASTRISELNRKARNLRSVLLGVFDEA